MNHFPFPQVWAGCLPSNVYRSVSAHSRAYRAHHRARYSSICKYINVSCVCVCVFRMLSRLAAAATGRVFRISRVASKLGVSDAAQKPSGSVGRFDRCVASYEIHPRAPLERLVFCSLCVLYWRNFNATAMRDVSL